MNLDVLEGTGTPFDVGFLHGERYADQIREFAAERVKLSCGEAWTGRNLKREQVLAIAQECLPLHEEHTPNAFEELRGMSRATGLSLAELLIAGGFTDFVDTIYGVGGEQLHTPTATTADDCTAVLVPGNRTATGEALFAQTWDMHASAADHVLMVRGKVAGDPEYLTFTSAGSVAMIGMNEAGLAVGINSLTTGDGQIGVMWTLVVRELLRLQSTDDALNYLQSVPLAGAHNYLLLDETGRGYHVEATPTRIYAEPLQDEPLIHTNHCLTPRTQSLERPRNPVSVTSSQKRLERATELLASDTKVTVERLQVFTRDEPTICVAPAAPLHIATCGAAVMNPATREFWAVKGSPVQAQYERISLPA